MAAEIGPALGLTADTKSLIAATEDLRDIAKAAAVAEKAADEFSGSGRRMSSALASALGILRSMDASLVKLTQAQRASNQEEQESARRAATLASQYQALRASMDPLYATSKRYEAALDTLNASQAAGVISAQEYQRSLAMLDAQYAAVNAGNAKLAGSTMQTANVFAQFNDIGMMAFSGQSPLMLAIQQGTQLNQVWAQLGGSTKAIGGAMRGAIMSMVSPINLLTIGLIAGGAALLQWGMAAMTAEKETRTLDEVMDDMKASVDAYVSANKAAKASVTELIAEYGLLAGVAREALGQQAEFEKVKAYQELTEAVKGSIAAVAEFRDYATDSSMFATVQSVLVLKEAYGMTQQQVVAVGNELRALYSAQSAVDRLAAAQNLSREMMSAYGSIEAMPPEMRALYGNLQSVITNLAAAEGATSAWAGAMSSVLAYVDAIGRSLAAISGGAIQLASIRAETEALKKGASLREAGYEASRKRIEMEGAARKAELAHLGVVGEGLAWLETRQQQSVLDAQIELDTQREITREREKQANKKGGGGGGAADLKAAQKGFQTIRELLEEESLFQFAEYEKRQMQLDAALAKNLLSEQQYYIMRDQLRVKYFGSEWEQTQLQYQMDLEALEEYHKQKLLSDEEYYRKRKELQWANLLSESNRSDLAQDLSNTATYFGQLYSLTGSSLDGLLKLQKGFSAASALVSAWEGYAKALADGGMTPWTRLMWAGKILSAGLGAVRAIKGASVGGGTSGAGASAGGSTAAVAQPAAPLRVSVDAFDANQLYTGAAVQRVFEAIQEEAGNRGIIWVPTN